MYWQRADTIVISDPHFGKDATFRAAGVPLPGGTVASDLSRLSVLLDHCKARRLLVLGDLIHARPGRSREMLDSFVAWREAHEDLEIVNVRGNHDLRAGDPPDNWNIEPVDAPFVEPPFAWQHEPCGLDGLFCVGGHLHPGVVLEGPGLSSIKAPCFLFHHRSAVMPAFGEFTGLAKMHPRTGDRVFVIGDGQVVEAKMRGPR